MSITIFADSACDLPLSYFNENKVVLIPLQVHLDNQSYLDLQTISPIEIYTAIREGKKPKTSQTSPEFLLNLFGEFAKENKQGIYISFSSELSGTYQTAIMVLNQVKETFPNIDLTIIDSKCASLGYGLAVKSAVERASQGATMAELIEEITFCSTHMEQLFTVEDLEFLARGGRISNTSAFVGSLLNIKPIIHIESGKLIPREKVRGSKKLLKRMIALMHERGHNLSSQTIGISHGDNPEGAEEWKRAIQAEFGADKFFINNIGASIGSHTGPGAIAIFFLNEQQPQNN